MTLWTFCQSVLLTFNSFAILNEQRFLERYGLGQSSLTSGRVSATSPRGQLIGLITATQTCASPGRAQRLVIFVKMVFGDRLGSARGAHESADGRRDAGGSPTEPRTAPSSTDL